MQRGAKNLKPNAYLQGNLLGLVNNLPRLTGLELLTIVPTGVWDFPMMRRLDKDHAGGDGGHAGSVGRLFETLPLAQLPDLTKLPQKVLSKDEQQQKINEMIERGHTHQAEAAKQIERASRRARPLCLS